jgi:hypothetical protein
VKAGTSRGGGVGGVRSWAGQRRWRCPSLGGAAAASAQGGGDDCLGLAPPAHWSLALTREARGGEDQHGDVVSPGLDPGLPSTY